MTNQRLIQKNSYVHHHFGHSTRVRTSLNPFTADPDKALHLPYWSNPPVLIFDIRALWLSVLGARVPECQKSKLVGLTSMALNAANSNSLHGTAGIEGVNAALCVRVCVLLIIGTRSKELSTQIRKPYSLSLTQLLLAREPSGTKQSRSCTSLNSLIRQHDIYTFSVLTIYIVL